MARMPTRPTRAHTRHPRRTQAERRAETQTRLLDVTIKALATRGYAGMSTNDVVRRAGVSRGALVHHYPTKAKLAVAALDRWLEARLLQFEHEFTARPTEEQRADTAIDVLWGIFSEPTYAAVLELYVAARTDSELRDSLVEVHQRFHEGVTSTFHRTFPTAEAGAAFDPEIAVRFAFHVLSGAVLNNVILGADAPNPPEAVVSLKLLAGLLVNDPWRSTP